jgi:alkylation response protein AidB-like acyl-CoA dehydrogenase
VAKAFASEGLYRLAAPRRMQGADADALTQIRVLETISCADASSGWNLMIGMETFGLLSPSMTDCAQLLEDPLRVLAGSTAAVGRADKDGDGWRVSGRWQFVSGIYNAQLFGATVQLFDGGERLDKPSCYALIEAPDYEVHDTWHTVGMRGSGSHDVSVANLWVPANQVASGIATASGDSPNLHFPRGPRLAYNKVAVALGTLRAALDAFTELARAKQPRLSRSSLRDRPFAQRTIAQAEAKYLGIRSATHVVVGEMWSKVVAGEAIASRELAIFQAVCSDAAQVAAETVHHIAAAAGTSANAESEPLARICRDAAVIRQHVTVAPHHLEDAGRLLFGLAPQEVMLRGITNDKP